MLSAARIFRTIRAVLSRIQSMARSACRIGGRRQPRKEGDPWDDTSDSFCDCQEPDRNSPDSIRAIASRTPRKAASVT